MQTRLFHFWMVLAVMGILRVTATSAGASAPDLVGFDGRSGSGAIKQYYFGVQEAQVHWGTPFHLNFAVDNQGNAAAGPFTVKLYLTTNGVVTPGNGATTYYLGDNVHDPRFTSGLAVNGVSGFINFSYYLYLPSVNPFGTAQTSFYINMVVDANNEVAESNETNNSNQALGKDKAGITILQPSPNIVVTDSVAPISDLSVNFGNVAADGSGGAVGTQTVTIANSGDKALTFSSISMATGSLFKVTNIQSSTQTLTQPVTYPRALAAFSSENWVVTLQFDPLLAAAATDTLVLKSDDPNRPILNVALQGTGVAVPSLTIIDPDAAPNDRSMNFGSVANDGAGGAVATLPLTLRNDGTGPLTINKNGIAPAAGTHFKLVSITSSTRGNINLASAASTISAGGAETWTVNLKFDPTATGALIDTLNILSNDPNFPTATVSLAGIGLAPMTLVVTDPQGSPTDHAVSFYGVHADGPGKQTAGCTLTLVNTGGVYLTIAKNGITLANTTDFQIVGVQSSTRGVIDLSTASQTIAANQTETWLVTLVFDPLSGGSKSNTLTIASNDPAHAATTVSLTGTGLTQPGLSVTTPGGFQFGGSTLDFGTVLNDGPGNRMVQKTILLKDVGTVPLVIQQNGITLSGYNNGMIITSIVSSVSGNVNIASANPADRTIAPVQNETWTVTVTFDPTTNNSTSALFDVNSNDPGGPGAPPPFFNFTGVGAQPTISITAP